MNSELPRKSPDHSIAEKTFLMVAVNEFGIDSATATAIVENSRIGAIADGEDWSEGVVADLMPTERVERADRIGRHLAHQIFKSLNNQP